MIFIANHNLLNIINFPICYKTRICHKFTKRLYFTHTGQYLYKIHKLIDSLIPVFQSHHPNRDSSII
jgi:hypothetical protein